MNFDALLDAGIDLALDHPLWALLAVVVLLAVIYWKPKAMLKLGLAVFTLFAIYYVLSFLFDLTTRGIGETEKFTSTPDVNVD